MSTGRILCTEDDPDSREMLVMMLTTSGYEVVCPDASTTALELATIQRFDLYLLDNWAAGMTGIELTKTIRASGNNVPIVFYSGVAGTSDQQEALDAGAQRYLTKPNGIAELVEALDKLVQHSRSATA